MWIISATLLLFAACWLTSLGYPRVTIDQGALRGKNLKTTKGGKNIYAFQGIPYAKPPIGELRFKDPVEADGWTTERPAYREGQPCSQISLIFMKYLGGEDCLYLNVYTPKLEREGDGLSVMFWLHGGGFYSEAGDTISYGPEHLLDHDVILVTINYRLGPQGFLSLGTSEAPGNYGLKDQVFALQWVQKNIAKFGGNPDRVTIFGESAGGASVHLLMLSPLAKGLFHRAIAQSGSAYNPWAMRPNARELSLEFTKRLGCDRNNDKERLACLRSKDTKSLAEMSVKIQKEQRLISLFTPVVESSETEGAFLTEDPNLMLSRGDVSDVPFMAGLMQYEGMLHLYLNRGKSAKDDYTENYVNYVPSQDLGLEPKTPAWTAAWLRIENFYYKLGNEEFLEQYLLLTSDVNFNIGVDNMVRQYAALQRSPVFYYKFTYDGELSLLKRLGKIKRKGTCHADEIGYLFNQALLPLDSKTPENDRITIDRITKLWTDFAKTGSPTPKDSSLGVMWKPVKSPLGQPEKALTRYFDIGNNLSMKNKILNSDRIKFWHELFSMYNNSKVIREEL